MKISKTTNLTYNQAKSYLEKRGLFDRKNYKSENNDPKFRKSVFKMPSYWVFGVINPIVCCLVFAIFFPGHADGPTGSYFFYATLLSFFISAATLMRQGKYPKRYEIKDNWIYPQYQGFKTYFFQRHDGWKGLVTNVIVLWIIAIFQFIIF